MRLVCDCEGVCEGVGGGGIYMCELHKVKLGCRVRVAKGVYTNLRTHLVSEGIV